MAFELPRAVYSQELLESVIYELEQYLEWFRQARTQQRVGAKPSPEPTYSAETALVIKGWLAEKQPTMGVLEELVAHLRGLKLPMVHLTLAALPNHEQRAQLVDWFRVAVGGPLLISFVADRTLGGGLMVRTTNRIFDYSWRERLVEGREKLAEIVNRV